MVSPRKKRKSTEVKSVEVKYSNFVRSDTRRKVRDFCLTKQPPTLRSVLTEANTDLNLPNFRRSTLHFLLKELGFAYVRRGSEAIVTGREVIVSCRHKYSPEFSGSG